MIILAKCPECKKEITHLRNVQSGSNSYDCWAEKRKAKHYLEYQHDDFTTDGIVNVWNCPECDKTLFTHEDDALEFLKEVC